MSSDTSPASSGECGERRLSEIDAGVRASIERVPDDDIRAHLLRVGLVQKPIRCRRNIHNGPVVIERNGTTMAIGAGIAARIAVTVAD
jgi:Fe2+ transport system protein FeoA